MLEFLFDEAADLKEALDTGITLSCECCKTFNNTYFVEHLRTDAFIFATRDT